MAATFNIPKIGVQYDWSRVITRFTDWSKRYLWRNKGRRKQLDISLKGNTKIPLAFIINTKANISSPYQTIYKLVGNYKKKSNESMTIKGNLKNRLLFESMKIKGKKDFKRLIMELLFDDDE